MATTPFASLEWLIARRYLRSGRDHRFFSWISTLSIVGISIAVAALIVVLSVFDGFERELRQRFLMANAHILLFRHPGGIEDPSEWQRIVQRDFGHDIQGTSPFVQQETMARYNSTMHTVLVRGIVPQQRESVQTARPLVHPPEALDDLQRELDEATPPSPPGIILGAGLLSIMNAKVGDDIELVDPGEETDGTLKAFRIKGIYDSGLKHYDNKLVIMSLRTAQAFFELQDRVTGLEIGLKNPMESGKIAATMNDQYPLSVRDWQSFNQHLFDAMKEERVLIMIIVGLVGVVAAFNILTTLFIAVTLKQREISVLRALGARRGTILRIFLLQSGVSGALGAALGCLLAVAISWLLERYEFVNLPEIYLVARLPIAYVPSDYVGISVFALILSLLAGIYPAISAARVTPVAGLVTPVR